MDSTSMVRHNMTNHSTTITVEVSITTKEVIKIHSISDTMVIRIIWTSQRKVKYFNQSQLKWLMILSQDKMISAFMMERY
jgi:hypothetical protein